MRIIFVLCFAFVVVAIWFAVNRFGHLMWQVAARNRESRMFGYLCFGAMQFVTIATMVAITFSCLIVMRHEKIEPIDIGVFGCGLAIAIFLFVRAKIYRPTAASLKAFLLTDP